MWFRMDTQMAERCEWVHTHSPHTLSHTLSAPLGFPLPGCDWGGPSLSLPPDEVVWVAESWEWGAARLQETPLREWVYSGECSGAGALRTASSA